MGLSEHLGDTERAHLNAIRLNNNWSIRDLAKAMTAAGWPISHSTLNHLFGGTLRHYDRTVYGVRKFLAEVEAEHRRTHYDLQLAAAAKRLATNQAKKSRAATGA